MIPQDEPLPVRVEENPTDEDSESLQLNPDIEAMHVAWQLKPSIGQTWKEMIDEMVPSIDRHPDYVPKPTRGVKFQ